MFGLFVVVFHLKRPFLLSRLASRVQIGIDYLCTSLNIVRLFWKLSFQNNATSSSSPLSSPSRRQQQSRSKSLSLHSVLPVIDHGRVEFFVRFWRDVENIPYWLRDVSVKLWESRSVMKTKPNDEIELHFLVRFCMICNFGQRYFTLRCPVFAHSFSLLFPCPPPCSVSYHFKVLAVLGAAANVPVQRKRNLSANIAHDDNDDDDNSSGGGSGSSGSNSGSNSRSSSDGSVSGGNSASSSSVLAAVGRALGGGGGSSSYCASSSLATDQGQQEPPSPIKPDSSSLSSSRSLHLPKNETSDSGGDKKAFYSSAAREDTSSPSSLSVPSPIKSAPNMPVSAAMRRFHAQVITFVSFHPFLLAFSFSYFLFDFSAIVLFKPLSCKLGFTSLGFVSS